MTYWTTLTVAFKAERICALFVNEILINKIILFRKELILILVRY